MALTDRQKTLIRETWVQIEASDLNTVGMRMFIKLFTDSPGVIPLFKFASNLPVEELKTSSRLQRHASSVMRTVGTAVSLLDDLDTLTEALTALGTKHIKYGAEPDHFQPVGSALIHALSETLGDAMTDEVREAWLTVYKLVTGVMAAAITA